MMPGRSRAEQIEVIAWGIGALGLVALGIPWFLWGDSTVAAGLPLWLWWHIGWMALASLYFAAFVRYGWGIGVVGSGGPPASGGAVTEGDRDG